MSTQQRLEEEKEEKMARLAPVLEEPINEEDEDKTQRSRTKRINSWKKWQWLKTHLSFTSSPKKSNIKILLSVLGCPLSPVPAISSPTTNVSSKAQYIIQQFRGATRMGNVMKSLYASGSVRVAMLTSSAKEEQSWSSRKGSFVVWQMETGMWLVELVVDGSKIVAGSDGKIAWRHTPWVGTHAAPGGVRPLRRTLQGLDPSTIISVFSPSKFMGDMEIDGENCFVLMLETDQATLKSRSDSSSETIKHVMVGYFSQRTGLLVHLDDFQLTRIQAPGSDQHIFWETMMSSCIGDYRAVDGGVLVAHSGRSTVNLVKFGQGIKDDQERMRMEEEWNIHDVVFNVPGLSNDCFIPPEEARQRTRLN